MLKTDPWPKADFGRIAQDYRRYRLAFPEEFYSRLLTYGVSFPGAALDLGAGTGNLGRRLARLGFRVTGLDPSPELLEVARAEDAALGIECNYILGKAEETGLPDAGFDLITVGTAWHWFDAPRAMMEITRLLRPGGVLAIAYLSWLPLPGSVPAASETLIRKYNPSWRGGGGNGLYPATVDAITSQEYFGDVQSFSFDWLPSFTQDAWCGRIRASAGVGAALGMGADQLAAFEAEHAAELKQQFPDPVLVPHRIFAALGRKLVL